MQPRIVEVQHSVHNKYFFSAAKLPVALQICQESRVAIINYYPLCFGSIFKKPTIRFHFGLDTLFFCDDIADKHLFHFFDMLKPSQAEAIRWVAVAERAGWDPDDDGSHEHY